jgi:hypothetical protein
MTPASRSSAVELGAEHGLPTSPVKAGLAATAFGGLRPLTGLVRQGHSFATMSSTARCAQP